LISIVQLGNVDYATGLRLQEQLVDLRKEEKIGDVLIMLEHKPVITLGRNAKAANIIAKPEVLAQRGVELFETNRGGDVTFHGPSQIVGYPIFDLRGHGREGRDFSRANREQKKDAALAAEAALGSSLRKHLGAVDFVRRLEEVLIRTCADFAIPTKRVPGLTGVWTQNREGHDFSRADKDTNNDPASAAEAHFSENAEAKLAAIGIHISRFVTSHGFALNVNTDLSYFNLIIPCGITTKPVTSMRQELGKELDLNAVAESISRNFGKVFSRQILWLESLDALLGRTVGVPAQLPVELRQLHKEDDTTWA
jgi:lipoyl(octanoyl) transferase